MEARTLTITLQPYGKAALRASARKTFEADSAPGDRLNSESAAASFGKLTERRWAMIHALQGAGEVPVRILARRLGRDLKRVHADASVLVTLGLIERKECGGLLCTYDDIHVDMHLRLAAWREPSLIVHPTPECPKSGPGSNSDTGTVSGMRGAEDTIDSELILSASGWKCARKPIATCTTRRDHRHPCRDA